MQTNISDCIFKSRIVIFSLNISSDIITIFGVSLTVIVYPKTILYMTAIPFPFLCGGNVYHVIHNLVIVEACLNRIQQPISDYLQIWLGF